MEKEGKKECESLVPDLKTGRHTSNDSLPVRLQTRPGWAELTNIKSAHPECLKERQGGLFWKNRPPNPLKNFLFWKREHDRFL
jgi:hypothetical protein